jgi:hypothetical protein
LYSRAFIKEKYKKLGRLRLFVSKTKIKNADMRKETARTAYCLIKFFQFLISRKKILTANTAKRKNPILNLKRIIIALIIPNIEISSNLTFFLSDKSIKYRNKVAKIIASKPTFVVYIIGNNKGIAIRNTSLFNFFIALAENKYKNTKCKSKKIFEVML